MASVPCFVNDDRILLEGESPVFDPAATKVHEATTYCFCSVRSAEKFDREETSTMVPETAGNSIDPVCSMRENSKVALPAQGPDNVTYYFCSPRCQKTFLEGSSASRGSSPIKLGPKP
jgi:YHS domain-containing protein